MMLCKYLNSKMIFKDLDIGIFPYLFNKGFLYYLTGIVLMMKNPVFSVAAFPLPGRMFHPLSCQMRHQVQ